MAPPTPGLPPSQEQNGDSHHAGDWRGPGRDSLPLPMRSRKYQEGPDATERRPRGGSHSPLDSTDVRVQVPHTVRAHSPGHSSPPRGKTGPGGIWPCSWPCPSVALGVRRAGQYLSITPGLRALTQGVHWGLFLLEGPLGSGLFLPLSPVSLSVASLLQALSSPHGDS